MGPEIGNYVASAFLSAMGAAFAAGVVIGISLWEGIPWLWTILKPFIHQVTA